MKTFLTLGSNPTLSLAEIAAVLGKDRDFSQVSDKILLLNDLDENLGQLQNRLAGVIKVGNIIGSMPELNSDELVDLLFAISSEAEGRIIFGISVYDLDNPRLAELLRKQVRTLGLEVKKRFKESGRSARFVTSRESTLSAVVISTNHLLESAGEFVLIASKEGVLIGQTRAVQDFKAWAKRDMEKPKRDLKRGMLPPKLARVMCNLGLSGSRIADRGSILDPFCGVGTVLIESAMLEINNLIGTDIDQQAIADTKTNLNWLGSEFDLQLPETRLEICPAEELSDALTEIGSINIVVTEPYLGPLQTGKETAQEIKNTVNELTSLYIESFRSIVKLLNKKSRVVVALPVFKINSKEIYIPVIKELEQIGLQVIDPIPESVPKKFDKKTPRNGILYFRPRQFVAREILVFKYLP